ncbi:hypothetical protein ACFQ07_13870, partial [Actinomadura adrarensis]
MAPKGKQPNRYLADLLAEAGMSNKGLAARVVRLGKLRGAPDLRYNHSSVARWLRGETPRRPVPEIIAEVLTIELGRRVTLTDIGMPPTRVPPDVGLELPTTQTGTARVAGALWQADLEQHRRLLDAAYDP